MDRYSPKHVERTLKIKSNHKNFVLLVGLYTYCRMMHGSYNIKLISVRLSKGKSHVVDAVQLEG
jgi:hypothetical protein